jgi:hypothetical protein
VLDVRLPGVRFESRPPPVPEDLPRMDIAAMVGFASAGPLHLPVAVEDVARFREIFGADPLLAWDEDAGSPRHGALGRCVESYFANGGQRCWIVRVAAADSVVWHRFALPGLMAGADDGDIGAAAEARARAPGSWCEPFAVGTALIREPLALRGSALGAASAADADPALGPLDLLPGAQRIDLGVAAGVVEAGELLELFFDVALPRLWLFAARVEPGPGFVRVLGSHRHSPRHTEGAYWLQAQASSPETDEDPALVPLDEDEALDILAAAGRLDALAAAADGLLADLVSVRRLRLELGVWQGRALLARLDGLGLAREHPRFWATLPTDAALLGSPSLARSQRLPGPLDDAVRSPRFPLAGPDDDLAAGPRYYLPIAVPDRLDAGAAAALPEPAGTPLERDGLARFGAELFVDPALAAASGALLADAEHRYYIQGRDLIGLHGLLPVGEVSLLSVPDAHHGGWTREPAPAEPPFPAPELLPIPDADEHGGYRIAWTAVADASGYLLMTGADPDFTRAELSYDGTDTETTFYPPAECPRRMFLRVRARRYGELGPWSNTRQSLLPRPAFAACADALPAELVLAMLTDASPPLPWLAWSAAEGAAGSAAVEAERFVLQASTDADFTSAAEVDIDATEISLAELAEAFDGVDLEREARRYLRVRGLREGRCGPWSNTVIVDPVQRPGWTLTPAASYDDGVLRAVHLALLRFAAARADLLALLSLPRHYRTAEAIGHVGRLTAGGGERLTDADPDTEALPLGAGERAVLGYGALVHPWLGVRIAGDDPGGDGVVASIPPDGAVLGAMAAVALDPGAWVAPANRPLQRVLALAPPLGLDDWRRLAPARVNLLLRTPRGFVLFSEATLGEDAALAPIHIRRLLILLRRLALREGDRFVFAPNDARLKDLVRHRFEAALAGLYARGAFAGRDTAEAFRVVVDASVNPASSVARGRFVVELQVAPARALAYITVRLVADERGRLAFEEAASA